MQPPGATLYRAWSLWGNQMTGGAFVSVETGVHGLERGPMGAPTPCCETSNNAANCMGCMGLPTAAYDPLKTETETPMESKDRHGGGGADAEGDNAADKDHSAAAAEGDYWPVGVAESFSPVAPQELFSLLPKLQQQLGGNPDVSPRYCCCCCWLLKPGLQAAPYSCTGCCLIIFVTPLAAAAAAVTAAVVIYSTALGRCISAAANGASCCCRRLLIPLLLVLLVLLLLLQPANLPCRVTANPPQGIPTLGDILRSRSVPLNPKP